MMLVAGLAAAAAGARAQPYDPAYRWRTLETAHFRVHFHQGEEALAQEVARQAERAHAILVPALAFAPAQRTEIVLSDDVDESNGSATPVPYDTIRLFAVPPESLSELNDYRDWVAALVFHEYAHILHLDHVEGIPAVANRLFGKLFVPNGLLPSWMIEGIAVLHEGDGDGSTGRNGNALFDMYARALATDGSQLPGLAAASNPYLEWPRGSVPYLLGGRFWAFVEERYGRAAVAGFLADQGSQLWPYAPSWAGARWFQGKSFDDLWNDFRADASVRYSAQLAAIRAAPVTRPAPLTRRGANVVHPRWSPDGRFVAYLDRSLDERPGLRRVDAAGRDLGRVVPVDENGTLAVASPTEAVVAAGEVWREFRVYDDLWRVDLRTGARRRLTDGARATDPDVAPDGAIVYVARTGAGEMALRRLPPGGGAPETLFARPGAQVFMPRVSPDGRRIAFELHDGGRRDIAVLEDGKVARVTDDDAIDLAPAWSRDGRWLLFASERTGVYNLYAWEAAPAATDGIPPSPPQPAAPPASALPSTGSGRADSSPPSPPIPGAGATDAIPVLRGTVRQITNVETGAFEPDVSPDGRTITFVTYSRAGYDLATLPFDPSTWRDPAPAPPPRPWAPSPPDAPLASHAYRARDTLGPTFWLPFLASDASGTVFGAFTAGGDVLARHLWALQAWWSIESRTVGYSAAYVGGWSWPRLDLSSSRFIDTSPGTPWRLESVFTPVDAGLTFTFTRLSRALTLRAGWSGTFFDTLGAQLPADSPPLPWSFRDGLLSEASLLAVYSDAHRYARSISPEEGRTLSLGLRLAAPEIGSDFALARARASIAEYLRVPGTRHVVLATRLTGAAARGTLGGRTPFELGGVAQPNVLSVLLLQEVAPVDQLRGYPSDRLGGTGLLLGNLELRFPLGSPEVGHGTWPLFLRRVHGALFLDAGDAFALRTEDRVFGWHPFAWDRLRFGAGAELRLEVALAYYLVTDVRIGLARGLGQLLKPWSGGAPQRDPLAEWQPYVVIGQSF